MRNQRAGGCVLRCRDAGVQEGYLDTTDRGHPLLGWALLKYSQVARASTRPGAGVRGMMRSATL